MHAPAQVLALTSDAPIYFLNLFVEAMTADVAEAMARRALAYQAVHLTLQLLLLGCCALPLHLYRAQRRAIAERAREEESDAKGRPRYEPPRQPAMTAE